MGYKKAWNSTFNVPKKPWKRKTSLRPKVGVYNRTSSLKRSVGLRRLSKSPVAATKRRIQALLREICMKRDRGCILASVRCNRRIGDAGVVWQADHLLSRSNSATYGDSRLVVLICRNCHAWKSLGSNLRKKEYDTLVRSFLSKERVALWDMAELEAGRHKGVKMDWALVEATLLAERERMM